MAQHFLRTFQRYALVGPIPPLYYLLRDRAWIAMASNVQVSFLIRFGAGCVVKPYAVIRTTTGRISLGEKCAVGSFNTISAGQADIVIGDHVRMGPSVFMTGSNRRFRDSATLIMDQGYDESGLTIGNDVLIGANAVILGGVTIGNGAVVGAGAVVTRSVPPYTIVGGMPARVLGVREKKATPS